MDVMVPLFLSDVFKRCKSTPLSGGASGAAVHLLETEQGEFVLKQHLRSDPFFSLRHEMAAYQWLHGKVPVPLVKAFAEEGTFEFLCMSRIPGSSLSVLLDQWPAEQWVTRLAETLRKLHAIPLDAAAPSRSLDEYLEAAKRNLENGLIDVQDLEEANRDIALPTLYQQLMDLRPRDNVNPVFIHGDYTPENVLFDGDELSGLIDPGRSGVGDRYHDLSLALRFIRNELDPAHEALFLRVYGLERIDHGKLAFYELLDEFF